MNRQIVNAILPSGQRGIFFLFLLFAAVTTENVASAQGRKATAAIEKGVGFLRKTLKNAASDGYNSYGPTVLAAYAMLKGGAKPSDPVVAGVVAALKTRVADGKYTPTSHNIYSAGCELMLLEAAETRPGQYRKEMKPIIDFIVKNQNASGYWNYLGGDEHGDTSVTQYAVLGLWAAKRNGLEIPLESLERAAGWLISNRKKNGAFIYRPAGKRSIDINVSLSMTVAGVSSVLVARRFLYPEETDDLLNNRRRKRKDGIVEKVDIITGNSKSKKGGGIAFKPTLPFENYNKIIREGLAWCGRNYRFTQFPHYTLYGIERMAALAQLRLIGGRDWYAEGRAFLLKSQNEKDGSWTSLKEGKTNATSFAVLFLSRATFKLLGEPTFGNGLLRGGYGLPTDLSTIEENKNGEIKKRARLGPIDDLLAELLKLNKLDVPGIQKAIVRDIQLGDRKKWLPPSRRKQLLKMANHKRPEVRSLAIWALGRTGHIDVATVLMDALEKDPDLDVAVEARNALCFLSRKPQGFNLSEKPQIPAGVTKAKRLKVIKQWRSTAVQRWKKWYLQIRPYRERDDLRETSEKSRP